MVPRRGSIVTLRAILLFVVLVTLIAFSPALWNDFVTWDDQVNLLDNPHYRGLGWPQLRWMFTTFLAGHWIPLTWLTFGLDYRLWGMSPFGYHLTNVLLHSANAVVFYLVALRLLRRAMPGLEDLPLRLGAGAAALFFALHPLRAESVAWVTERRDVLSGLFFLLTLLTYLRACEADETHRRRWLASSLACYALALASKSIVMTLPLVLIVLDLYPLRRLGTKPREWIMPAALKVWAEKAPYFVLALAGAGLAFYAVNAGLTAANSGLTPFDKYPLPARLAMAFYSLWFYAWKTVLPLGLSVLYELPVRVDPLAPPFLGSAIAVGVITGGLFLLRRRWPAGLAVWVAYAVMLAPVSGFPFHAGHQLAHDRYSYLPCLGMALLVGAGVGAVIRAGASGALRPWAARLAAGATALWLIGLGGLTWQQVQVWRDSQTLWIHAAELDPACSICQNNVGSILLNLHLYGRAIEQFQRALAVNPDYLKARGNLGVALVRTSRPAEAIEHLHRVLAVRPDDVYIRTHLALALLSTGRPAEAIEHFQQVLERDPANVDALNHLGVALVQQGRPGDGIEHLRQAIRLDPSYLAARTNLGVALTGLGNPAEAIEHLRQAIELRPSEPLPHFGLAQAYLALGKTDLAREEYSVLNRLDPGLASQLSPLLH